MSEFPLLSMTIFSPLIGAILCLFAKDETNFGRGFLKAVSLLSTIITLLLAITLYYKFDFADGKVFQFEEKYQWFSGYNIGFYVGIDGIALALIMLTSFLMLVSMVCSFNSITYKLKQYFIFFLVLESLIIGAFSALDFVLFYVLFEAVLIPMFLIIGIWGSENRIYAAYKFFLYTLLGSLFLLVGVIYIYQKTGTANVLELYEIVSKFDLDVQRWLWIAFFMSFAIKIPMIPVHTWLPDAHVQAPTAGSIILAGVLLKMGGYGFIRFSVPMLPEASAYFANFVFVLSVIAIIYASLTALVQSNMKKLIAYSSIAHMGFVTAGIFAGNLNSMNGAVIQMISHGLISGGLFLAVGILSDRTHTKEIDQYGGTAKAMPIFATLLMILTISSVALPGTSAFIGEFLILLGVFQDNKLYAALAATGMVLGAAYMLWFYFKVMFGAPRNKENFGHLTEINFAEALAISAIIIVVVVIGIYPIFLMDMLKNGIAAAVTSFQLYK